MLEQLLIFEPHFGERVSGFFRRLALLAHGHLCLLGRRLGLLGLSGSAGASLGKKHRPHDRPEKNRGATIMVLGLALVVSALTNF